MRKRVALLAMKWSYTLSWVCRYCGTWQRSESGGVIQCEKCGALK